MGRVSCSTAIEQKIPGSRHYIHAEESDGCLFLLLNEKFQQLKMIMAMPNAKNLI